jgi:hypothetical protein
VLPRTAISMTASADLEVKRTVDPGGENESKRGNEIERKIPHLSFSVPKMFANRSAIEKEKSKNKKSEKKTAEYTNRVPYNLYPLLSSILHRRVDHESTSFSLSFFFLVVHPKCLLIFLKKHLLMEFPQFSGWALYFPTFDVKSDHDLFIRALLVIRKGISYFNDPCSDFEVPLFVSFFANFY